ncbi:MAG TPA: DUF5004 domain-containing protein [Flavisolibacter sp.]|nr:DUF5004 domain-containing protein [Flavisolibacter sp.]
MKKINRLIALFTLLVVLSVGCKPEDIKEFTPAQSSGDVNAIAGTWKGFQVVQRDMDAERKGFPFKALDITAPMQFTDVTVKLNTNNGAPSTFEITYGNGAPLLEFTSGTWRVDNNSKVGNVELINNLDTIKLKLGSYNLIRGGKMQWTTTKKLLGKEVIAYDYTFTK